MMIQEMKNNRAIVISDDIDCETAAKVIERIHAINMEDSEGWQRFGEKYDPAPIALYINSYGGEVPSGLGIIGAMETSQTPIQTIVVGAAYSMALPIAITGDQRIAHRYANFMYHQIASWNIGRLEDQRESIEEMERSQAILDSHIKSNTKIPKNKLDKIKMSKKDWYFTAEEALRFGVVDGVVQGNGEIWTMEDYKKAESKRKPKDEA